jgi:hypothetical protein
MLPAGSSEDEEVLHTLCARAWTSARVRWDFGEWSGSSGSSLCVGKFASERAGVGWWTSELLYYVPSWLDPAGCVGLGEGRSETPSPCVPVLASAPTGRGGAPTRGEVVPGAPASGAGGSRPAVIHAAAASPACSAPGAASPATTTLKDPTIGGCWSGTGWGDSYVHVGCSLAGTVGPIGNRGLYYVSSAERGLTPPAGLRGEVGVERGPPTCVVS